MQRLLLRRAALPALAAVAGGYSVLAARAEGAEDASVPIEEYTEEPRPPLKIFSGSAHPKLASQVAEHLGVPLGLSVTSRFNDGEVNIKFNESIRGADVFIVQPTCSPVNDSLMELLLMVSAARRSSAATITAVIPYFGYKRSVGRPHAMLGGHQQGYETPVSAADIATMLELMGVHRVITVEFYPPGHGQTDGFFRDSRSTIDNIEVTDVGVRHFSSKVYTRPLVVISPNPQFVQKAHDFALGMRDAAKRFGRPLEVRVALALKPKTAAGVKFGEAGNMQILGDVSGCDVVIVDDTIDTGKTLRKTTRQLRDDGAERIFVFATHGLFNGDCLRLLDGTAIEEIVVTDSIPISPSHETQPMGKVVRLGMAERLANVIESVYEETSIHSFQAYREDTDMGRYSGQDSQAPEDRDDGDGGEEEEEEEEEVRPR
jgi:ribose-phosphate pyrophosphokinase